MRTIVKRGNGQSITMPERSTFTGLIDRWFQDNLNNFFNDDDSWGFTGLQQTTGIPVNVRETDKNYELDLVAPGLKKEDFQLNVSDDMLTVSFERRDKQENRDQDWSRREYKIQSFTRSFNLDDTVDANNISAEYHQGILHLILPKKEGAQKISRQVEVK
jgi:HSP20 family protein